MFEVKLYTDKSLDTYNAFTAHGQGTGKEVVYTEKESFVRWL